MTQQLDAFPHEGENADRQNGLTKREYAAIHLAASIAAASKEMPADMIAKKSVKLADALALELTRQ